MSAKVLRAHYGSPVVLPPNDPTFDLLCGTTMPHATNRRDRYTVSVEFLVNQGTAQHIAKAPVPSAAKLLRHHKNMLCWFVATTVLARGPGAAKGAIYEWCRLHNVTEDDVSSETLYKVYQRFGWRFSKKNVSLSGQLADKTARVLSPKKRPKTVSPKYPVEVDMALVNDNIAKSLTAYGNTFRGVPVRLPRQMRIYIIHKLTGATLRDTAQHCAVSPNGVHTAIRSIQQRMARNRAVRDIVEQALALPIPI
jgi:hypothetical protein